MDSDGPTPLASFAIRDLPLTSSPSRSMELIPNPVMRWAELRSVLRHLEDHAGRVFHTAEAASEALFDDGGGFGISSVLRAGVLDQLHTQQVVGEYVLPPRMAPGVTEKLGVYVYALIDPRDRSIFYVGKGVGDRVYSHVLVRHGAADLVEDGIEREARAVKSAKNQRIRDIYQSGKQSNTSSCGIGSNPTRQPTRAHTPSSKP